MRKKSTSEKASSPTVREHGKTGSAVPHRYPLELVANVAVRFSGDGNFAAAAKRALALLDACTAALEGNGNLTQEATPAVPPRPTDMYWEDFVADLTDGERKSRAESKINDFFKFDVRRGKAVELAKPWGGTTRVADRMWARFIKKVPETTPAELNERVRELNKPREELISGKKLPAIISGGLAEIFKGRYSEWQQYEKTKKAA